MKLFVGILLATLGIILLLSYLALSLCLWIRARINEPADRYVFLTPIPSLKTLLLSIALSLCGIILAFVGFEIIT